MFNKFKLSSITKNIATLSFGTGLSFVVPLFATPILARIYAPKSFAVLSLYTSSINIISQIITLKYDYAITASKEDKEAKSLFFISLICTVSFSLLLFLLFPFKNIIAQLLNAKNDIWVYFVPFGAFFVGLQTPLVNINIYLKRFKNVATSNVLRGIFTVAIQVICMKISLYGLIYGVVIAYFVSDIFLFVRAKDFLVKNEATTLNIKNVVKTHKNYPKFMVVGSLANAMSYNIQSFIIVSLYSEAVLGDFSVLQRLLSVPITIISTAVGQAILKQTGEEMKKNNKITCVFSASKYMWIISAVIFSLIFVFADIGTNIILGNKFINSAIYLRCMIVLFAVKFAVTPIILVTPILEKQRSTMIWQFTLLIISICVYVFANSFNVNAKNYIFINSLVLSADYMIFYFYTFHIIKKKNKRRKI